MKIYPESAPLQLEFDKIKALLTEKCKTEFAKSKATSLRIHTKKEYIDLELRQSHEYKQLAQNSIHFPNDYVLNLSYDLKLLSIEGALLSGEQLVSLRKLAQSMESIFRWFDAERRSSYPALSEVIRDTYYEKAILQMINDVVENAERKEVYRILKELTKHLAVYASLLQTWHSILGEYDFIRAKALLASDIQGEYPVLSDKAMVHLVKAHHPLLYLYNQRSSK